MTRRQLVAILPIVVFQIVFAGMLYFMTFSLLSEMDAPAFFIAAFLGVAGIMMVMSVRTTTTAMAKRLDAAEPRIWTWAGTAVGVILMIPILLELLFGR